MKNYQASTMSEKSVNEQETFEQVVARLKKDYDLVIEDGEVLRISNNDLWGFANRDGTCSFFRG